MLNGIDPLLVIVLKNKGVLDFFGANSLAASLFSDIGVPIPIYLSEKLTGIYVDTESRSIDVTTKVEPVTEKDPITLEAVAPQVTQTAVDTQVTISLLAREDSILLVAIVTLMESLISRLVSQEYAIHYLNKSTALFGGLLHSFKTMRNPNDDLVRLELTLSTAAKEQPTPKTTASPIAKVGSALTP